MAKFKTYKKKNVKTEYTGSRKKNRKQARAKRILSKHPAVEEQKILEAPKSLKWVVTHFPQLIKKSVSDILNKILPTKDNKRNSTLTDKLNSALEYASDKFGYRDDYQKYLGAMLGKMMGDDFLKKLMKNHKSVVGDYEYFTIDDEYANDHLNNLFKYIHFKDVPDDVEPFVDQITDLNWSSEENYAIHNADIQRSVYKSNLKYEDVYEDNPYFIVLESIMQSSAAWDIARRSALNSDQRQENWFDLFTVGSLAYDQKDANPEIWDSFVQMVDNREALFYIEDKIDEMLIEALKE